jgi:hypothetical protein
VSSGKNWSNEETEFVKQLHESGIKPTEISKALNRQLNSNRSPNAVSTHLWKVARDNGQTSGNGQVSSEEMSFYDVIVHDRTSLRPYLQERQRLIYGALKGEADGLREYDNVLRVEDSRLRGRSFEELLTFQKDERQAVADILTGKSERKPYDDMIHLLMVPNYCQEEGVSLMMPLYQEDVQKSSNSLRSALHDTALSVCLGSNVFELTDDSRSNWGDLLRYRFNYGEGKASVKTLEANINGNLSEDYDVGVQIHYDNGFLHSNLDYDSRLVVVGKDGVEIGRVGDERT